jgi:hypothetical protein
VDEETGVGIILMFCDSPTAAGRVASLPALIVGSRLERAGFHSFAAGSLRSPL